MFYDAGEHGLTQVFVMQVIATTVIGGVTLFGVLPAYEIFISKKGREPYLPLHLFKNIRFQSAAWNTAIGACVYYGFAIIFPQTVTTLYYQRGLISEYDVGTLAGLVNMGKSIPSRASPVTSLAVPNTINFSVRLRTDLSRRRCLGHSRAKMGHDRLRHHCLRPAYRCSI